MIDNPPTNVEPLTEDEQRQICAKLGHLQANGRLLCPICCADTWERHIITMGDQQAAFVAETCQGCAYTRFFAAPATATQPL